jgi:hypothetical protein
MVSAGCAGRALVDGSVGIWKEIASLQLTGTAEERDWTESFGIYRPQRIVLTVNLTAKVSRAFCS